MAERERERPWRRREPRARGYSSLSAGREENGCGHAPLPGLQERGDDDGDDRHELQQDVERRPGRVLEGVADRVTHHRGLVWVGAFASQVAFLDALLRVVPGPAG